MSALTLVMSELTDLDPEEFLNVRAYHTCGKNFRQVLLKGVHRSPTNSDSSGFSSSTSPYVSAAEEESSTRASGAEAPSMPRTPSKTTKSIPPKAESLMNVESGRESSSREVFIKYRVNTIEEVEPKENEIKNRIYFSGRDILNLERNLQPFKWQLASPLHEHLNPFMIKNTKFYLKKDQEYPMFTCENCDFRQPLVY